MAEEQVAEFIPEGASLAPSDEGYRPGNQIRKILTDGMASIGYADPVLIDKVYNLMQEILNRSFSVNAAELDLERQKLNQKRIDLQESYNLVLGIVQPLIARLELGPFDQIVSVGISDGMGSVRVVNVTGLEEDDEDEPF